MLYMSSTKNNMYSVLNNLSFNILSQYNHKPQNILLLFHVTDQQKAVCYELYTFLLWKKENLNNFSYICIQHPWIITLQDVVQSCIWQEHLLSHVYCVPWMTKGKLQVCYSLFVFLSSETLSMDICSFFRVMGLVEFSLLKALPGLWTAMYWWVWCRGIGLKGT